MTIIGDPVVLPGAPVDASLDANSVNPVRNSTVKDALDDKVDKIEGKGLSANDYDDSDKAVVTTVSGLAIAANNGKLLCIVDGDITAAAPADILGAWRGGSY